MKLIKWIPSVKDLMQVSRLVITQHLQGILHISSSVISKVRKNKQIKKKIIQSFIICITCAGSKGQPSFAKLFKYPNLNPSGLVASKSFFQGDRVEMKWSKPGNCVLLMTSTDVDTSGASYYGKQTLHFLDVKGTSAMVQLRNNL